MIKKAYEQPEIQVLEADMDEQILAGSITRVTGTGLDEDELDFIYSDDKSGNAWDDAW